MIICRVDFYKVVNKEKVFYSPYFVNTENFLVAETRAAVKFHDEHKRMVDACGVAIIYIEVIA